MQEPNPWVTAARVRAARAYSGMDRIPFAQAAHMSPSTLDAIEGKRANPRGATWPELDQIAAAASLPFAWFTADLAGLDRLVPEGYPRVARTRSLGAIAGEQAQQQDGTSLTPHGDAPRRLRKGRAA